MENIIIKETNIEEVMKVHMNILEFCDANPQKKYFEDRYANSEKLIIVAYYNNIPIGYIIGYDKFKDGSFYCWMTGVDINYRRKGIFKLLMNYQINWIKEKGYNKLKIKTRNNRREMLSFLVKNNFNFVSVEPKPNIIDNRINLELIV